METKISSKGQVVIPKIVRENLRIKAGDSLIVIQSENKIVLVPKPADALAELVNTGKKMPLRNIRREIKGE